MQLPTTIRAPIRSSLGEYARMRLTPGRASSVNFMALKYPLVQALVIVIADLYLPEEGRADAVALPGLERIARFATRSVLAKGWRPWLAERVGCADLAKEAPASIAARCCNALKPGAVWLATPVHCSASLASVHLEHRGLLKLSAVELAALAADFGKVFEGSEFALLALAGGGFLLTGPAMGDTQGSEPARAVGMSIAAALPQAPALRRLGAEIEIWLHEHPVNSARSARGELPVTGLWLWGGGIPAPGPRKAARASVASDRAYGSDPYLSGLWCARGGEAQALPESIAAVEAAPARCSVILIELAELLTADRRASLGDALALLDARWLAPAAAHLARGAMHSLTVIANDRCLTLARRDFLKLWRRARPGLAALA
jgi:hypothetical protein